MPLTHPQLTDRYRASIHQVCSVRASAAAELGRAPKAKRGTDWYSDRVSEVAWCNRWLAHQAGRLGVSVDELLGLAGRGPAAN